MTKLDHIIIAATTLEEGVIYIKQMLGVDIPIGGRHEIMATHNHVMSLGDGVYLELIATNTDMTLPKSPRWFALDDPLVRMDLQHGPRLLTWAVNSTDLEKLTDASEVPLGQIREAERDDLRWKVALSEDGRMPGAGFLPLAIQWLVDFHPSQRMAQLGCHFKGLTLYHPRKAWLKSCLRSIGAEQLVEVIEIDDKETPYLECKIEGLKGEVAFKSIRN